jgi:hypothetical protein
MLHLLFIPDLIKKERSFLLKNHSLIVYSIIGFCLILFNLMLVTGSGNVLGYATNISSRDLLMFTNQRRDDINLSKLKYNEKLSKAAAAKAENMFKENYWAHISPSGTEPWYFIKQEGYEYLYAGENLAVDFSNSDEVVDAWYNSPTHKENLLSPHYTDVGFAIVNGELKGRKTTLIVQMFGSPLDPSQEINSADIVAPDETNMIANKYIANASSSEGMVLNAGTVFSASKYIAFLLGIFLVVLLVIDGYYAKLNRLNRVSGHTFIHIIFLAAVLISIWYTNVGLIL